MKKALVIAVLMLFSVNLWSQNEYNIWYFGRKAGVDFNSGSPVGITDGKLYSRESSSSICDSRGNLLFYTNGDTVWNRLHNPMMNWQPANGFKYRNSSMQGSIILPMPGNPGLYYIFMSPSYENYSKDRDSMLCYSIVDMNGDGGLGALTVKERPLLTGGVEAFAVTLHANRKDYWIAMIDGRSQYFKAIRTVNGQLTLPPDSQKLGFYKYQFFMNQKFSPDSRVFTGQSYYDLPSQPLSSFFDIYRFDNTVGRISDRMILNMPYLSESLFNEFSHDSRFLYSFQRTTIAGVTTDRIIQYDLSVWDSAVMESTKEEVYKRVNPGRDYIRGLQIGPDHKIYMTKIIKGELAVIDFPEKKGLACGYRDSAVLLSGRDSELGIPYYPSFWFHRDIHLGNDTVICEKDTLELNSGATDGDKVMWNTGDTTTRIKVWKEGTYIVTVNLFYHDTIHVKVARKFRVYLGSDTAFCQKFSYLLKAGVGAKSYSWSTGETTELISVNREGIYSVLVRDSFNCPAGDTIIIEEIRPPVVRISYDSVTCKFVELYIEKLAGLRYSWNTGDTGSSIRVFTKGKYSITASHKFCSNKNTIDVDKMAQPELDLGPDEMFCKPFRILKTGETGKHFWNTGETSPFIQVEKEGIYWVTVERNNCIASDTIQLTRCEDMSFFIPDAFSPNGDGVNDLFKAYGVNIMEIEFEIFNRWGEKIAVISGNHGWDGSYKGAICQEGVYFYLLKIKGLKNKHIYVSYLNGTFTLLK